MVSWSSAIKLLVSFNPCFWVLHFGLTPYCNNTSLDCLFTFFVFSPHFLLYRGFFLHLGWVIVCYSENTKFFLPSFLSFSWTNSHFFIFLLPGNQTFLSFFFKKRNSSLGFWKVLKTQSDRHKIGFCINQLVPKERISRNLCICQHSVQCVLKSNWGKKKKWQAVKKILCSTWTCPQERGKKLTKTWKITWDVNPNTEKFH